MRALKYAALTVGLSIALACEAHAAGDYILGDSLGVGVTNSQTERLRRQPGFKLEVPIAKGGVRIRDTNEITSQINRVPVGEIAFLLLGTNDAVASLKGIETEIDKIVQAADARKLKLFWIGPPCVRKPWNKTVAELDKILDARLKPTSVKYVSTHWDDSLCGLLDRDGVHMTTKGYDQLWGRGRMMAGLPVDPSIKIAAAPPPKDQPGSVDPIVKPAEPPAVIAQGPQAPTPQAPKPITPAPPATSTPVIAPTANAPAPAPTTPPAASNTTTPVASPQAPPTTNPSTPTTTVSSPPPSEPATIPPPDRTQVATKPPRKAIARRPAPQPRRVVESDPVVRVVVTPVVTAVPGVMIVPGVQPIGPIRVALGLGPDPYLEAPFPLRRRR